MLKVMHNFTRSPIYIGIAIFLASLISLGLIFNSNINSAHAANSADIEASVNIKPSLTLNIPTNNITMTLDPSTHAFDEKDLTVSVGTNNRYGYQLLVNTTGTDLINVADNSKTIPTLTSSTSAAAFPANQWGIRKTANSTSSTGDYGAFATPYSVSSSSGPVNSNVTTLGFGAKIDYTKESGLYNLNLEFKALPIVTQTYMQNMDTNLCTSDPTVAIDSRDEKAYTIRRLPDGRCWMVENLRFTGMPDDEPNKMTVTPTNSNVASATTITYSESATGSTSGDSYTDAKLHVGTVASGMSPIDSSASAQSNIPTVWYNYFAASAGTVATNSNTYEGQYDICPAGWRIPSYNEIGGISGLNDVDEFSPIIGGTYIGGVLSAEAYGYYWTTYPSNTTSHWVMRYMGAGDQLNTASGRRETSLYIRCILNEPIGTVTTLQQFGALSSSDKTALKNSMTTGRPYTLRDTRDNQMYTVVKLKDGNVWFANSLNLGGTLLNGNLTSSNTNLSTTVTKATFEGWRKSRGTQTLSFAEYIQLIPGNSTTGSIIDPTSGVAYGTLYNFCAASGGNSTACADTIASNPGYDICPSGWRLPTGNTNGEFDKLYAQYNSKQSMRNSIVQGGAGFALSGYFDDGPPEYQGSSGYYWSSTRKDNTFMYDLIISGSVNAVGSNGRGNAFAIRCILK